VTTDLLAWRIVVTIVAFVSVVTVKHYRIVYVSPVGLQFKSERDSIAPPNALVCQISLVSQKSCS
jgi:hypothetical protein